MQQASSRQRAAPPVQPAIAEVLRTCVHPPILSLRVDHVIRRTLLENEKSEVEGRSGFTTKLFLTDGELVVQALLHRKLSSLPEIEELSAGDVMEIHEFVVRRAKRKNGRGHVVYLGIENAYVIKSEDVLQPDTSTLDTGTDGQNVGAKRKLSETQNDFEDHATDEMAGGFFRDEAEVGHIAKQSRSEHGNKSRNYPDNGRTPPKPLEPNTDVVTNADATESKQPARRTLDNLARASSSPQNPSYIMAVPPVVLDSESDDDNAFETAAINFKTATQRRHALHELSQNVASPQSRPPTRDSTTPMPQVTDGVTESEGRKPAVRFNLDTPTDDREQISPAAQRGGSTMLQAPPISFMRSDSNSSRPRTPQQEPSQSLQWGPFHTLHSLYSPSLPSKSYVFTTLVIPTYVASHLISRPNNPFPPKRHIKVIDPSLVPRLKLNNASVMGKGITVSVYRDALNFMPNIGKVALIRGVVMQRLAGAMRNSTATSTGEVILNVYPGRPKIQLQSQSQAQGHHNNLTSDINGVPTPNMGRLDDGAAKRVADHSSEVTIDGHWFIDNHNVLREQGYEVDAMQKWWDETTSTK